MLLDFFCFLKVEPEIDDDEDEDDDQEAETPENKKAGEEQEEKVGIYDRFGKLLRREKS